MKAHVPVPSLVFHADGRAGPRRPMEEVGRRAGLHSFPAPGSDR